MADEKNVGISLQAAKYSSEDAGQIVEYIQLVLQFSRKYQPYKKTLQILESLKQDKEDQAAMMEAQKISASEESIVEVCSHSTFYGRWNDFKTLKWRRNNVHITLFKHYVSAGMYVLFFS